MQLADRVKQLKPSATLAVNALAQELKARGQEVISLSIGEPDFITPANIRQAAARAMDSGHTRYTAEAGITELRQAVAAYFNDNYAAGASFKNILTGTGGKQCLYNLFMALLNPGDEALVPAPYWVSYPPMIELAGAVPVPVPSGAEKGFKVGVEDLEKKRGPRTKVCVINSPSNPTGALYSREELDAIAAWAVQNNIFIISDEIYDRLVYKPDTHHSLCGWWQKHPENFAVVNGVAKTFAMTGWRLGYMLAHEDLIKAAGKLQGQSTSNPCSISQYAAIEALTGSFAEAEAMRESFDRRRKLVMERISGWPDVLCPTPQGAFYVFPDVHRLYNKDIPGSQAMCKLLLEKAGVALVPGEAFGDDNCVRISYATDDETLRIALDRIASVLFK